MAHGNRPKKRYEAVLCTERPPRPPIRFRSNNRGRALGIYREWAIKASAGDREFGDSLSWSLRLYEHGPESVESASAPHTDTSGTYRPSSFFASLSFPGSKVLAETTGGRGRRGKTH